jgi:hypothetical protein
MQLTDFTILSIETVYKNGNIQNKIYTVECNCGNIYKSSKASLTNGTKATCSDCRKIKQSQVLVNTCSTHSYVYANCPERGTIDSPPHSNCIDCLINSFAFSETEKQKGGMSFEAIAAVMNSSPQNIDGIYRNGISKLRDFYHIDGSTEDLIEYLNNKGEIL